MHVVEHVVDVKDVQVVLLAQAVANPHVPGQAQVIYKLCQYQTFSELSVGQVLRPPPIFLILIIKLLLPLSNLESCVTTIPMTPFISVMALPQSPQCLLTARNLSSDLNLHKVIIFPQLNLVILINNIIAIFPSSVWD